MSRIFTQDGDKETPQIDQESVKSFFQARAKKAQSGDLSYKQAIIYQDKNADFAEARDRAEKELLLPKLELNLNDRFLDIGCGTGRWTELVADKVAAYHGTDLIDDLLKIARQRNQQKNISFTCLPCTDISLISLNEKNKFSKIIMFGVLMYLNDENLKKTLEGVAQVSSDESTFLLREPIGVNQRLTIKEHFSEDMEQTYNAIYRTEKELLNICDEVLGKLGFQLVETADVFTNNTYNNRVETKQKFFLFKRQ